MKRLFARVFTLALCLISFGAAVVSAAGVTMISKEELRDQLNDQGIILLDVRAKMNWALSMSKIKGAVREDPTEVNSWKDKYPKDKLIVLYCQTDVTSSGVARQLTDAGFQNIRVLKSGWGGWSSADYPSENK